MADFTIKSREQLVTLDEDLIRVLTLAKAWCGLVDFQISQGARTIEQQRKYFQEGKSKVNPDSYATPAQLYAAAKHITGPGMPYSRAADLFVPGQEGGAYDKNALCYVAGLIRGAAMSLGVRVRWGGDFDRDGKLLEKGTFQDLPHIELD